ncbi:DUF2514 family protein [Pseudomonas urethralis]|uniref:DUF2514 family protein n=1 Tax=Pseudomonas urethralis TaxID=2740517 RepID=UPI001596F5FB
MNALLERYRGALAAVAGLALVGLLVGCGFWLYGAGKGAEDRRWREKWANLQAQQAQAQAADERQQREEEQRRQGAVDEVGENAREQNAAVAADVAGAGAVDDRVRAAADNQLARVGAACGDPGVARRGEAATRAAGVLSHLLKRADERAGVLAAAYDRARVAGLACEAAYDQVRGVETKRPGVMAGLQDHSR